MISIETDIDAADLERDTSLEPRLSPELRAEIMSEIRHFFADRPTISPSEWCVAHLTFDEPGNRAPYSLAGREYIREPLDSFGDPEVSDGVLVLGSQAGKTGLLMGGVAYLVDNDPSRVLWVMASEHQAATFAETRWLPMLRRSPLLAEQLPKGAQRHAVKNLQQAIGASIVNFFGSNSPGNLASIPARVVVLDEVDKFSEGTTREADAVSLAEQRTKSFGNAKRYKASTPTMLEGLIWQELQKTDLRRRQLPCPSCGRFVVLAWSRAFTVFPLRGDEAFITWDQEARRPDRTWDLDRVERSARAECPHCGAHIRDSDKSRLDRAGRWVPTQPAARGRRGWHMPSLYATSAETSFGRLALKFLQAKRSFTGLQSFINGELAEPYEDQHTRSERYEIIVAAGAAPLARDPLRILTVDHQLVSPFFWYIVRDWYPDGSSRRIAFGSCEEWSTLREIQVAHGVADNRVVIDHKFATATVNQECLRWGQLISQGPSRPPIWVGWMPCRGFPENARWKDKKTGVPMIYSRQSATADDARLELPVLYFNGPAMKDILAKLRRGPDAALGLRWEIVEHPEDATYFAHLDAEYRKPITDRRGRVTFEWTCRSRRPNHLLDCEVEQIAAAMFHRRLRWADAMLATAEAEAATAAAAASGEARRSAATSQLELPIQA
jgi:phage terminase large subunit GpA-like protein